MCRVAMELCTRISFIDSTSLEVCDPKRINQHRVFATDAKRSKTNMGWFYGFKLLYWLLRKSYHKTCEVNKIIQYWVRRQFSEGLCVYF